MLTNRQGRLVSSFRFLESLLTILVAIASFFAVNWMANRIEKERKTVYGILDVTFGFQNMIYIATRREGIHQAIVEEPNGFYQGSIARSTFQLNIILNFGRTNIQRGHEAIFMNFKQSSELETIFEDIFLGKTCDNLANRNYEA